jgi:hypothetical protein
MIQKAEMFKKIKSLFVVEDAVGNTSVDEVKRTDIPTNSEMSATVGQSSEIKPPSTTFDGKPDAKFTDLLLRSIESNNMDGFDYLEYKNSLKSIESVIPDEVMRYKSAFEMAKTMGLSKEKLIQSASHYLNILISEDKKFKDALENQKAKQIQGRADQLAAIEKSVVEKQQMIEKLNKEIESSKGQLEGVRKEINDAVVKIDVTNQQFVASYNLVYGQIYEDIEKIKTNI